jgi:anthranilate synthase/aminodeoxychorismate synthase-like glutamine amidotransferase
VNVIVIDHHDSYTWNLVHLVAEVTGSLPDVVQHDEATASDLRARTHIVLSPGPGTPDDPADFSIGRSVLRSGRLPVLGVCLGLQGLVRAYGGQVRTVRPAHGEVATIRHDGTGVFRGLPAEFRAVRYHSLAAVAVPACLSVTARSEDGTVMGVRHRRLALEGVQFHPESVLSEHGARLMANFLGLR